MKCAVCDEPLQVRVVYWLGSHDLLCGRCWRWACSILTRQPELIAVSMGSYLS